MHTIHSKHRLDHVSNAEQCKRIRKVFGNYFRNNIETEYTGIKVKSKERCSLNPELTLEGDLIETGYLKKNLVENYDFMHLVLTVPHKDGKWRGETFYCQQIIKAFNLMRKRKAFKEKIFAGEFSTEIVRKHENGFHIHIHALLLVKKELRNRNILHATLIKLWNKVTIDETLKKRSSPKNESKHYYSLLSVRPMVCIVEVLTKSD